MTMKSLSEIMNAETTKVNTGVVEVKNVEVQEGTEVEKNHIEDESVDLNNLKPGDDVRGAHSSVLPESNDNLAALVKEMEQKAAEAEELAIKAQKQEAINEKIESEREAKKNTDTIIEVDDDNEDKEETAVKRENEITDEVFDKLDAELRDLKVLKFKKDTQARNRYDKIIERRQKASEEKSTQVGLINSGYFAKFTGFRAPEVIALEASANNMDPFSAIDFQYKKIHAHMCETSVGKMGYDSFLKNTSLLELNTIFFGLFSSTNPDENEYPGTCTHADCKSKFNFKYKNSNMLFLEDEDREQVSSEMSELLTSSEPEMLLANSNVQYTYRKKLSTGTVVEFRHPSLYNQLIDTIKAMKVGNVEDPNGFGSLLPFIESIFVYDAEDEAYFELEDVASKILELDYINETDFADIVKIISRIQESYKIKFGFRNLSCPVCKQELPNQQIDDMGAMLFMLHQMKTGLDK